MSKVYRLHWWNLPRLQPKYYYGPLKRVTWMVLSIFMLIALSISRHFGSAFKGSKRLRATQVSTNHSVNPSLVTSHWVSVQVFSALQLLFMFSLCPAASEWVELCVAPPALLQIQKTSLSTPVSGFFFDTACS